MLSQPCSVEGRAVCLRHEAIGNGGLVQERYIHRTYLCPKRCHYVCADGQRVSHFGVGLFDVFSYSDGDPPAGDPLLKMHLKIIDRRIHGAGVIRIV